MSVFFEKVEQQLLRQLPFVLYCKPHSEMIVAMFQQNDRLYELRDYSEKGFVLCSFDGTQNYLIPEEQSVIQAVVWEQNQIHLNANINASYAAQDKRDFEELVAKGVEAINGGAFQKLVLSRREIISLKDFDLVQTYLNLVNLYQNAFVYCYYHPKLGLWIGATPEQLLKANVNVFETVALAGTQKDEGSSEISWGSKERQEQQYVTDYIVERLEKIALEVAVTEPYNFKAGTVWHLKTDIWGVWDAAFSLKDLIGLLHPTPAVCGLPKEEAKSFIIENENYDRRFYTGFLGELNSSFAVDSVSSSLFVNLRCMEIKLDTAKACLFMGCGITKDSVPEKEWEESLNKSMTMKKVLSF